MKLYAILSYNPFIFLIAKAETDPLDILREDYNFIKEDGLYPVSEAFKPLTRVELCAALDKYMQDNNLDKIQIQAVGAEEFIQVYSIPTKYYANNIYISYPTYADTNAIKDYSKHHPKEFNIALENAVDLSLKNYIDGGMGTCDTSLQDTPINDEDVIAYVMIPLRVIKTPILSFSETRADDNIAT